MKVEQIANGGSQITVYAPALILFFEIEAKCPRVSIPDEASLARILGGVDEEWRELLLRALDDG